MPNALIISFLFGATPAQKPERPPEPCLKGVHPTRAKWRKAQELLAKRAEELDK